MSCLRGRHILLGCLGLMIMMVGWACGPGDECTNNGDCINNPSYGAGYTCVSSNGKNVCEKACPSSCESNDDCQKCTGGKTFCVSGKCGFEPTQCPATCTGDSDCTNCDSGKNFCLGGICAAKAAVCPSTCTSDGDCVDCAGGNNQCISGTCGQQAVCKATCTSDSDCAGCPDEKTICKDGACAKKVEPLECPIACSADADCAGCPDNRTACTGGACVPPPQCPSSCSADADCANCASGLNFCISGKCDAKSNPQCPSSCSADADCSSCPNSRTKCENSSCVAPPQCPSLCSADADCANCPANQQSCVNSKCDQKPQCPSSCRNDSECSNCASGKTFCVNNQCDVQPQCPSSCTSNSDCAPCASNQQNCVGGKCGAPPACPSNCAVKSDCAKCADGNIACVSGKCGKPTTCPSSCTLEAECVACGGNYTCNQSKCEPKKPPLTGPGQECDANNRCITGDICITVPSGKSYCFEDCSSNANLCAKNTVDGRTQCVGFAQDASGNTVSVCLNVAKKGEPCGFGVQNQAECQRSQSPPLYCTQKSLCGEAVVQTTVGAACNKSTDNTDPLKICDPAKNLTCNESTGKCATVANAKEGEECDPTGQNLGKIVRCDPAVSGLTCIRFDSAGTINYCHLTCTPSASNQCSHKPGLTCAPLLSSGGGLCMDTTCTTNAGCAFTGYECGNSSSTTSGKLCLPPLPSGPKKYMEVCGSPARTNGCSSGFFCLSEQGKTNGLCTIDCTTAGTTCPRSGSLNATCTTINANGDKACLFTCSSASPSCPPALTCNTNLGFCLAP